MWRAVIGSRKKSTLVHRVKIQHMTKQQLEIDIERLLKELGSTLQYHGTSFKTASDLDLAILLSSVEAQKARRNDSAFLVTIFSSLIALATVATTDLIESWTISHLLTFTIIWLVLLMSVERFFDHRMERLVLVGEYLQLYKDLKLEEKKL